MTEEEIMEKNITLSFEFSLYTMEHPEFAKQIPKDARIVLLPKDDPELCRINREAAERAQAFDDDPHRPVVFIEIEKLLPARSRLVNPRLVSVSAG
jgi:hypothetical protein